jgi:hypothetical protein
MVSGFKPADEAVRDLSIKGNLKVFKLLHKKAHLPINALVA